MKIPPFCPNKCCSHYNNPVLPSCWFVKDGHFSTNLNGSIQRFKCKSCGTHFSSQTFSLDYMVERRISYQQLINHLVTSSGIRDIARTLKCSPRTVTNRISRLARQAMAIHADLCSELTLSEDLVADGFESFTCSQYFPNNIQILAGKESQFWFLSDYAHLRRKGRMTVYQKARNIELQARFIHNRITIYESFERLALMVLELQKRGMLSPVHLFTDEHLQYVKVLKKLTAEQRLHVRHIRLSSKKVRNVRNPLFSVNYLDREIRKDCAEHTRETVQFARNAGNSMERLAIYRLHHNYRKPFRINGKEESEITHAEKAGIPKDKIRREMATLFTQRRFLGRIKGFTTSDALVWLRFVVTPLKQYADYLPAYAWA